jgi:hypothetical protein
MPVGKVESVMVTRAPDSPESVIIRASGSVASAGWTDAKLSPMEAANTDARTRVFSFVATSPETPAEDHMPQSVETELRVDGVPAELHTIRVIAATNAISAPVLQ